MKIHESTMSIHHWPPIAMSNSSGLLLICTKCNVFRYEVQYLFYKGRPIVGDIADKLLKNFIGALVTVNIEFY